MVKLLKIMLFNGKTLELDFDQKIQVGYGSSGVLYKIIKENKSYLIKVLTVGHDLHEIFRRMKLIRENLLKIREPYSIIYRTIPLGQCIVNAKLLGPSFSDLSDDFPAFLFNFVEATSLEETLKNLPPLAPKRIFITKKIVKLLACLERAKIIHYDLYPDNLLVAKNNEVYLIDLESAGVLNETRWIWRPLVKGKTGIFCYPPELEDPIPSPFFDRWNGLYLLYFCLFGYHPFSFLMKTDGTTLKEVISSINKKEKNWPPEINTINKDSIKWNENCTVEFMKNQIYSAFGKESPLFMNLLFRCYVIGFNQPHKRPALSTTVYTLMKSLLNIIPAK